MSQERPAASSRDEAHPRPQLVRERFHLLDGACGFAYDDADVGRSEGWSDADAPFTRQIQLPFSPESAASGIGETGFHPVVWYRRALDADDLTAAGFGVQGSRVLLHLGAIDHRADVWVDGHHVAHHVGGQTAFTVDVTHALSSARTTHHVVIRAEDDPLDAAVPRGKQDWHGRPRAIWYHRATGIWRSLWVEAVPEAHITDVAWTPEITRASVRAEIDLSARPGEGATVEVDVYSGQTRLAHIERAVDVDHPVIDVPLDILRNGQAVQELLWSPENPRLLDARVTLRRGGAVIDSIDSYFGVRTVTAHNGRLMLNARPFMVRSVLQQGYWPDSHYTAPSVDAMREEIELILRLGFNSIRIHQKVEDPRYLYWCDRLGLTVWAEAAAAYEFSPRAVELYAAEWTRIVRNQRSHPSIIVWVPFNESWGVHQVGENSAQRAYVASLTQLTRALDQTRPVVSNDGWEHVDSDLATVHDYESSGEVLAARYADRAAIDALLTGLGPAGRAICLPGSTVPTGHLMVSEFGGVRFQPEADAEGWGYSSATDADDFERRVRAVIGAIRRSPFVSGFCYTQLTDTEQEVNGLCDANRVPKLPEAVIRQIVAG